MQKISLFHQFSFEIQSISESRNENGHTYIFDWLLIFVNLYQNAKNQFIISVNSSDTVSFRVLSHDWPHSSLTMQPIELSITF